MERQWHHPYWTRTLSLLDRAFEASNRRTSETIGVHVCSSAVWTDVSICAVHLSLNRNFDRCGVRFNRFLCLQIGFTATSHCTSNGPAAIPVTPCDSFAQPTIRTSAGIPRATRGPLAHPRTLHRAELHSSFSVSARTSRPAGVPFLSGVCPASAAVAEKT